ADFRLNIAAVDLARRDGRNSVRRIDEAVMPQDAVVIGPAAGTIAVERIDAVMLGGDKNYVVRSPVREAQISFVKRLRVDVAIHAIREQHPKVGRADVGGRKNFFLIIGAGKQVVVMPGQHIDIRRRKAWLQELHPGPKGLLGGTTRMGTEYAT